MSRLFGLIFVYRVIHQWSYFSKVHRTWLVIIQQLPTSSLFSFLHFPLQSSYATYVWSGPRCFFKNDRQNYLKKLFARCGSVVIFWSVMTTYLVHICKGNKLDTQTRLQCPQERRRVSAALTWQPICYILSQRSCSRINTCEIEQLFSAKKYAARTHT